ncbi:hypothetical protein CPB86DRAFT_622870 [Serendipita vermifera]|nr:hypothetical protein CPB86DRAFT_622870 [Serendipita vermifera]
MCPIGILMVGCEEWTGMSFHLMKLKHSEPQIRIPSDSGEDFAAKYSNGPSCVLRGALTSGRPSCCGRRVGYRRDVTARHSISRLSQVKWYNLGLVFFVILWGSSGEATRDSLLFSDIQLHCLHNKTIDERALR